MVVCLAALHAIRTVNDANGTAIGTSLPISCTFQPMRLINMSVHLGAGPLGLRGQGQHQATTCMLGSLRRAREAMPASSTGMETLPLPGEALLGCCAAGGRGRMTAVTVQVDSVQSLLHDYASALPLAMKAVTAVDD